MKKRQTARPRAKKAPKKKGPKKLVRTKKIKNFPEHPEEYFFIAVVPGMRAPLHAELQGEIEEKVSDYLHGEFGDESDGAEECRRALERVEIYKVYKEQRLDADIHFEPAVTVDDR